MRALRLFSVLLLTAGSGLVAQTPSINVDQVDCLPQKGHAVIHAHVVDEVVGNTVRLYFRRLNDEVEDFYYVPMQPAGGGEYWAALPEPADAQLRDHRLAHTTTDEQRENLEAAWWKAKEASQNRDPNGDLDDRVIRERASVGKHVSRSWMHAMSLVELQEWLTKQRQEPAEYYGAVFDSYGKLLSISPMEVTEVRRDCRVTLTPIEQGQSKNLIVGETAPWQKGEAVFHWTCDGIVTRIDDRGIMREDSVCRACVIAWWKKKQFLIPAAAGAVTGIVVVEDEPNPSPSGP